jgi:hypothetical protein
MLKWMRSRDSKSNLALLTSAPLLQERGPPMSPSAAGRAARALSVLAPAAARNINWKIRFVIFSLAFGLIYVLHMVVQLSVGAAPEISKCSLS